MTSHGTSGLLSGEATYLPVIDSRVPCLDNPATTDSLSVCCSIEKKYGRQGELEEKMSGCQYQKSTLVIGAGTTLADRSLSLKTETGPCLTSPIAKENAKVRNGNERYF